MTVILLVKREVIEVTGMIDRGFYHDLVMNDSAPGTAGLGTSWKCCAWNTFVHHAMISEAAKTRIRRSFGFP